MGRKLGHGERHRHRLEVRGRAGSPAPGIFQPPAHKKPFFTPKEEQQQPRAEPQLVYLLFSLFHLLLVSPGFFVYYVSSTVVKL